MATSAARPGRVLAVAAVLALITGAAPGAAPGARPPRDGDNSFGPRVWDVLALCESGGNWASNSGNGYYGGLQFSVTTWESYGGDRYAALPHLAARDDQIAVARAVRDDRGGYRAWPRCARKLGLPR